MKFCFCFLCFCNIHSTFYCDLLMKYNKIGKTAIYQKLKQKKRFTKKKKQLRKNFNVELVLLHFVLIHISCYHMNIHFDWILHGLTISVFYPRQVKLHCNEAGQSIWVVASITVLATKVVVSVHMLTLLLPSSLWERNILI